MNNIRYAILLTLLTASINAFASKGGGSGVSSGGTGMSCQGLPTEMLDTFIPGIATRSEIENRASFISIIKQRLFSVDPLFAISVTAEWDRLGDSEYWGETTAEEGFSGDAFLAFDRSQLPNCSVVQIAAFEHEKWVSSKIEPNYTKLNNFQRRILELHEALYILGVRDFNHLEPTRTRKVIEALLSKTETELGSAVNRFKLRVVNTGESIPTSDYVLLEPKSDSIELRSCPMWLQIQHIGFRNLYLSFDTTASMRTYKYGMNLFFEEGAFTSRFGHETDLSFDVTTGSHYLRFSSPELSFNLEVKTRSFDAQSVVLEWKSRSRVHAGCVYELSETASNQ